MKKRGAIIAQTRPSPSVRAEIRSLELIPAMAGVSCRLLEVFQLSWELFTEIRSTQAIDHSINLETSADNLRRIYWADNG